MESKFKLVKVTKETVFDKEDMIKMIVDMAKETEEKALDNKTVTNAVDELIRLPEYGYYILALTGSEDCPKQAGMDMITYEFNICENKTRLWIQSVFVKPESRKQGLFKSLLKFHESSVGESDLPSIKLYMEVDNEVANKTYLNQGFEVRDTMFEVDFHFDKFKQPEFSTEFVLSEASSVDFESITQFFANSVHEISSPSAAPTTPDYSAGLKAVFSNPNLGKVFLFKQKDVITHVAFIFFEFSDWRHEIFWYGYKMFVSPFHWSAEQTDVKPQLESLLKAAQEDKKCCGLRFIVEDEGVPLFKDSCLLKPHYYLFEKRL